ncbi:hypothetical protein K3495_g15135 [Podosphaera aphanis]|nr:hypothetical protein K3495_g15135 [Podosphaera aphanis]
MYGRRIKEPLDIAAEAIIDLSSNSEVSQEHMNNSQALLNQNIDTDAAHAEAYPIHPNGEYRPALIDAAEALKFSAMWMKDNYDTYHQAKYFNVGDFVALRLHRGYNVPGLKGRNTKIEQQFAGPFQVLERIGRLAYRIQLPPSMSKIHPVISVAYLEPAPNPKDDPFCRPSSQHIIQDLIPETILNKRVQRRRNDGEMTQYLVRYKGRTADWDNWILDRELLTDLVEAFERSITTQR